MKKNRMIKFLVAMFSLILFFAVSPKIHAEKTYTIGTDVTYPPSNLLIRITNTLGSILI